MSWRRRARVAAIIAGAACAAVATALIAAWWVRWLDREAVFRLALLLVAGVATLLVAVAKSARERVTVAILLALLVLIGAPWLWMLAERVRGPETQGDRMLRLDGRTAPDFEIADLDGRRFRLSDQRGRVVVIEAWRSWCGYCPEQFAHLAYDRQVLGDDVVVVGLDPEPVDVQRAASEPWALGIPLLRADASMPLVYQRVHSFPTTFVIDREGRFVVTNVSGYFGLLELDRLVHGDGERPLPSPMEPREPRATPVGH